MKTADQWLRDPSLYATSALALLTDRWGVGFLEWDPTTIGMELRSDFGVEPTDELLDKVNAAASLFTTDLFWVSLETFSTVCNTLNFGVTTSNMLVPADLDDVLWGVTEATILMGDDMGKDQFSHNVARYVGTLLADAGVEAIPSVLRFAEMPDKGTSAENVLQYDAEFNKAYYDEQQNQKNTLEGHNNVKIMMLFRQIAALPLKTGNAEFIRSRFSDLASPSVQRPA